VRSLWFYLAFAAAAAACGSPEHPPPFVASGAGGAAASDAGLAVDAADGDVTPGLCGQEIIPAITDLPTLYFALDRSGSMQEAFADSGTSKYDTVRGLLGDVLRQIGHRVRYGAAVFPALSNPDGCAPGVQVFPTTTGDPPSYARDGQTGPILRELLLRLGYAAQEGGTPTAATLNALRPTLVELGPRTHVVLATDGAPNCNVEGICDAGACMLNVEQAIE
jgi:hypothetical protein